MEFYVPKRQLSKKTKLNQIAIPWFYCHQGPVVTSLVKACHSRYLKKQQINWEEPIGFRKITQTLLLCDKLD